MKWIAPNIDIVIQYYGSNSSVVDWPSDELTLLPHESHSCFRCLPALIQRFSFLKLRSLSRKISPKAPTTAIAFFIVIESSIFFAWCSYSLLQTFPVRACQPTITKLSQHSTCKNHPHEATRSTRIRNTMHLIQRKNQTGFQIFLSIFPSSFTCISNIEKQLLNLRIRCNYWYVKIWWTLSQTAVATKNASGKSFLKALDCELDFGKSRRLCHRHRSTMSSEFHTDTVDKCLNSNDNSVDY